MIFHQFDYSPQVDHNLLPVTKTQANHGRTLNDLMRGITNDHTQFETRQRRCPRDEGQRQDIGVRSLCQNERRSNR